MAILINAHELSKSYGARPLFRGVTFSIETGDRIGLIGPNGAGKSTLLKILASQIAPDVGKLSTQRGLRIGLLEQNPVLDLQATLLGTVLEGADDPHEWESIALAQELISKLELESFGAEAKISKLSGGWRKRVALARELIKQPDLLLLDEPTNHLDIESILWLENFLSQARFATLTITHDRMFLQRVSNRILELDPRHPGGLLNVRGDYAHYVEARSLLISAQERREVILKNTLRRETEWLRQGAKARTTKQQARIQRHGELEAEVADLSVRNQVRTSRIDFHAAEKNPKRLLVAKGISKSYGSKEKPKKMFESLDLVITPGTRLGLLGKNGSGKSTLIRTLLGQEKPDTGQVIPSDQLSVAYFDQTREALDPLKTAEKTLCPSGDHVEYRGVKVHIRSYLDRFLFTQTQMDMPVGRLSGGEQSRILIARLMLTQANLLVLDEPTNDLDMATLAVLEECLVDFAGAVILVTHDRYFLDQVSNQILAFPHGGGKLASFANLAQWEEWQVSEEREAKKAAQEKARASGGVEESKKKRKLSFNEQRELDSMETNIHQAEERLKRLTEESERSDVCTNSIKMMEISKKMSEAQEEIDRLYRRWEELG